jgi:hypothetical protein
MSQIPMREPWMIAILTSTYRPMILMPLRWVKMAHLRFHISLKKPQSFVSANFAGEFTIC